MVFQLFDLVGLLREARRRYDHPLVSDVGQRGSGKASTPLVDREAEGWEHTGKQRGGRVQGVQYV